MDRLLKIISLKEVIFALRTVGELALGIGIITTAVDKAFGGWTPVFWFLLCFAFFPLVLCSELLRIVLHLETKR